MSRTLKLLCTLACAAGMAGCETALPELFPQSDVILLPSWAETGPGPNDFIRVYPIGARRAEIESDVRLDCTIRKDRKLDCKPRWEEYPGLGFGEAAIQVASMFVVKADDPRVQPGATVIVPIAFRLEY